MSELIDRLAACVELGKPNRSVAHPPELAGQPGADELCREALESGIEPLQILEQGLVGAMHRVGERFSRGEIFVPDMLLAARAMMAAMVHLRPAFASGEVRRKGVFVIGTVAGDLHDLGKNMVAMMVEGAGWEVIDLGKSVKAERFLETIDRHPGCAVGLSALLTTTMVNMEKTVAEIRARHSDCPVLVGGAPVNQEFCTSIGASFTAPNPHGAVEYLKRLVS